MRIPSTAGLAVFLSAGLFQTPPPAVAQRPLPDRDRFMALVRSAVRIDEDVQKDFTYIERRRDVRLGPLGKMSVGPLRTFEVLPSSEPGQAYKRLIAVDGKPLDPAELKERDADHQRELDNEARRLRRETPGQQAKRLERSQRERRDKLAILEDAFAVFDPSVASREFIEGEATIAVVLTPRTSTRVSTREGGWMKQFQGRAWFLEQDGQFVRLDMHAIDDVAIGWGILGRLYTGSRIVVERRRVGPLWLPARLTFEGSGRTLLFRPFELNLVREYGEYRGK